MDKSRVYEFLPLPEHPVIEGVWRLSAAAGEDRIAPDTRCELIVHLTDAPLERTSEGWRIQAQQMIYGPLTQVLELKRSHPMKLYAIRLRPEGIGALDSNPRRFRNRSAPLSEVLDGAACSALTEAAGTDLHGFALVAATVFDKQGPRTDRVARVSKAIRKLEEQPALRSRQLAESLGVSVRTLDRDFMRVTGLRPGEFSRIHRYHSARLALQEERETLSDIALDSGYSDQAHMNREFKHFAGLSPRAKRDDPESDIFYH